MNAQYSSKIKIVYAKMVLKSSLDLDLDLDAILASHGQGLRNT